MWDKRAKVLSNHDGDTLTMSLDQGFGDSKEINVRLLGVFAPELKQVGGKETQQFVADWVSQNSLGYKWPFIVTTIRGPRSDKETATLGRFVGVVETIDHGCNLNTDVMAFVQKNGYMGGTGS